MHCSLVIHNETASLDSKLISDEMFVRENSEFLNGKYTYWAKGTESPVPFFEIPEEKDVTQIDENKDLFFDGFRNKNFNELFYFFILNFSMNSCWMVIQMTQ